MTTLKDYLRDREEALAERWLEASLKSYARDAAAFFGRERDPFANPVGQALRAGTRGIVACLLRGMEAGEVCRLLEEIIRIRAVQEFAPSQAVGFVQLLKEAVRAELGGRAEAPEGRAEMRELDAAVDQVALFAFDIYVRCRDRVQELRIDEVKRSVALILERGRREAAREGVEHS